MGSTSNGHHFFFKAGVEIKRKLLPQQGLITGNPLPFRSDRVIFASFARTTVRRCRCPRVTEPARGTSSLLSHGGTSTPCRPCCWPPGRSFSFKNRRLERQRTLADVGLDGRRLVRIVALIHLGIALHAAMRLVQELLTMRVMGVPESFANLIGQSFSVIVNPLLALGLWLAWPSARWLAIGWYCVPVGDRRDRRRCGVGAIMWRSISTWWPDHLRRQGDAVLSARRHVPASSETGFRPAEKRAGGRRRSRSANEPAPTPGRRWSIVSLIALLFLIVVVSNLAVDTADWIERSVAEWNQTLKEP